jgi:hypothetical protein
VLSPRALRQDNLKPGRYTLVVNTNKRRTTGGVRLKTRVTR